MIINCSKDSQACTYDVARDGGGLGVHRLGLYMDEFSFVTTMVMKTINSAFTSAGMLATVSIGALEPGGLIFQDQYFSAKVISNIIFSNPFDMDQPNNRRTTGAVELILFVGVEPLTAGELLICVDYFNTDL